MSTSHPPAEDPPSPSHHLNIPNDDDDDDGEGEDGLHDHKYPHPHSDQNTPTQDAIIDVLAHLHPQPQSNDDASDADAGYHSFSHPPDLTSSVQEAQTQPDVSQDPSAPAAVLPTPSSITPSTRPTVTGDLSSTKSVSLKGWSKPQLRDEVLRLRRLLASQPQPHAHAQSPLDASGSTDAHANANIDPTLLTVSSSDIGPSTPGPFSHAQNNSGSAPAPDTDTVGASGSAAGDESKPEQRRKRKAKDEVLRDGETGKRVERSRRTELGKALRNKASSVFCSYGSSRDDVESEF